MKRIEALLPLALAAARKELVSGNAVRKEYDGYVASFVPSVRTAGLLPTLSFYTDVHKVKEDSEDKGPGLREPRRFHVLQAIHRILNGGAAPAERDDLLYKALHATYEGVDFRNHQSVFPSLQKQPPEMLCRDIMEAAIALKLALRNFKQVEK